MIRLSTAKRTQVLHLLVEGNSMQATSRIADVGLQLGCEAAGRSRRGLFRVSGPRFPQSALPQTPTGRNLELHSLQATECGKRKSRAARGRRHLDVDGDRRGHEVGPFVVRGQQGRDDAKTFVDDLASRLANRVQLTTDGHKAYLDAIEDAFGNDIDYAMLIKTYGENAAPGWPLQPGSGGRLRASPRDRQARPEAYRHTGPSRRRA